MFPDQQASVATHFDMRLLLSQVEKGRRFLAGRKGTEYQRIELFLLG